VVDGRGLAGGGEIEDSLGVDAAAGELVEVLRQLGGLLVASADVVDDAVGLDVQGFTVAGVDLVGEVAVVRRLAVVVGHRAGHRPLALGGRWWRLARRPARGAAPG